MKNFLAKARIRRASTRTNNFNESFDHYTTQEFFTQKPLMVHECVPGESISVDLSQIVRVSPLREPFYGSMKVINTAFFVPCRTLCNNFAELITQSIHYGEDGFVMPSSVPYFKNSDLVDMFIDFIGEKGSFAERVTGNVFDFIAPIETTSVKFKFTRLGRIAYDILVACGYKVNFALGSTMHPAYGDDDPMSSLPLLSYFKLFSDYYKSNQFDVSGVLFQKWDCDSRLTSDDLSRLFLIYSETLYEKDYFTSAWASPSSPNTQVRASYDIPDPLQANLPAGSLDITHIVDNSATVQNSANGPILTSGRNLSGLNSTPQRLTQTALDTLRRLTAFVTRRNIVGLRPLDRYFAERGQKLQDSQLDRAIYIGSFDLPIRVMDVTATAETDAKPLGGYAGKAIGGGNSGKFTYKTNEFGFFVVVSTVIPHIGYCQGISRHCYHTSPLDFYTPDFDGLSFQPIRADEVISGFDHGVPSNQYRGNGVFGFTSRYAEYKTQPHDFVTGDFIRNSRNTGLDSWHLLRLFNKDGAVAPRINSSFVKGQPDQFNRVFNVTPEELTDHFITVVHFDVKTRKPMSQLFDFPDMFGSEDATVNINGTQLT